VGKITDDESGRAMEAELAVRKPVLLLTGPCATDQNREILDKVAEFGTPQNSSLVAIDEEGALTLGMMLAAQRGAKFISHAS